MSDAREVLEDATRKSRALLAETEEEVAAMINDAREQGLAAGESQARVVRKEIEEMEARMLDEVAAEATRAALRVARDIVQAEIAAREDAVVDIACTALSSSKSARDINLRANPKDTPILRAHKHKLISVLARAKDLEIREDRRVQPGGVLIETESGVIDAQLETQLDEIERVLTLQLLTPQTGKA